ncbi:ATP-grasp domain-containing protein [Streptomyces sp. NPDC001450]
MIVLCGVASDPPLAMVGSALDRLGVDHAVIDQRRFGGITLELAVASDRVHGHLLAHGRLIDCAQVTGMYNRLVDWRTLPQTRGADDRTLRLCLAWHEALSSWMEIAPGCVMNRAAPSVANHSKPYQAQLIGRAGFKVPETLVTNDPQLVLDFRARHGRLIYKSISSVRSIVHMLDEEAIDRLDLIRGCPVQFQRYVSGTNVRVHTVAGEVFATRIASDRVDYRYASLDGGRVELTPWELPSELAERCLALAARLGLTLAGIDLLLADDGDTYCFEVNPSPAFSYYESHTNQPLARSIARALRSGREVGDVGEAATAGDSAVSHHW